MNQNKNEITKSKNTLTLFLLSIILVSAIMFIVALFLQVGKSADSSNPIVDIFISCLYSIATSLIASVLVVFASSKILGEPLDAFIKETNGYISKLSLLNQSASTTGLVQVFPRRADNQEVFFELLSERWQTLNIMAVKLEFLSRDPRFGELLLDACKRGAKIRILLIDITNGAKLLERAAYEATPNFVNKAEIAVSTVNGIVEKCNNVLGSNLKLELLGHSEYLPITMMQVDDHMLYYTRTRNQSGGESPLYMVKNTPKGIFQLYLKDFDYLWEKYKTIKTNKNEVMS